MAKNKATETFKKQNDVFGPEKQSLKEDRAHENADANLLQSSINAQHDSDEDTVDSDVTSLGYIQVYNEAAEDADDEFDGDDDVDYEEVRPLIVKEISTSTDRDQVHLLIKHTEQNTQITEHTHDHVGQTDNFAQAGHSAAETGTADAEIHHTAQFAPEHNLPQAPTRRPDPPLTNKGFDLLHPSPPQRSRKDSKTFSNPSSESLSGNSVMSSPGQNQDAIYAGDFGMTNQRGKILEARGNRNDFGGEEPRDIEDGWNNINSTSSDDRALKPKAIQKKKSFRSLFRRNRREGPTTPPSKKTEGRMVISAPTLVDASPNAKALLSSASSISDVSPRAKHVVNFSRPITLRSSSDGSRGSPVPRGREDTALHGANPIVESGDIKVGLSTSSIDDDSSLPSFHGSKAADKHAVTKETLATEENAGTSDSEPFNPSEYSGDENSVQQAVAVPIAFSGRAEVIDVPIRRYRAAAPANQSSMDKATVSRTTRMTDQEAIALGEQDAERYLRNATKSLHNPTEINTDDPFIDPPFQKLLAKPANEIAAKEMARIKAAREAGKMSGGLIEKMDTLRAQSDGKPEVENRGDTSKAPQVNTGDRLLSKMHRLKNRRKKEKQEESEEEVRLKVRADVMRGLREENEIHAIIKAKLAAKDAANRGLRGAGIPRIDYGPPSLRTALGANDSCTARGHSEDL